MPVTITQATINTNISSYTAGFMTFGDTWPGGNRITLIANNPSGPLVSGQMTGALAPGDAIVIAGTTYVVCTASQTLSALTIPTVSCYVNPTISAYIAPRTVITSYTPAVAGTGSFATVTTNGTQNAGALTISLTGTTLTGTLKPGDAITVAANIYYVTVQVTAAANAVVASIFPPIIGAGHAGGVTATYTAATPGTAAISTFQTQAVIPMQYVEAAVTAAGNLSSKSHYNAPAFSAASFVFSSDNSD